MLLVTRVQNLVSHITPEFIKALSPLTKKVIGVGLLLAGGAAVWLCRQKAAPSLHDRVKNDAEQFRRISLLKTNEHLQVDIQKNEVTGPGVGAPTAEAIGWLKSFAAEMVLRLDNFRKELLATTDVRTKEEGMRLIDGLRTSLKATQPTFERLANTNDRQALLESITTGIKNCRRILKKVGMQFNLLDPVIVDKTCVEDVAATLFNADERQREFTRDNFYPAEFVRDFHSFGVFFIDRELCNTAEDLAVLGEAIVKCLSGGGVANAQETRLAAFRLYKLLVNSHYKHTHDVMAQGYFATQGLNYKPVGKNYVKLWLNTNTKEPFVAFHLVKVYQVTSTAADPRNPLLNPPAVIVTKKFTLPLSVLRATEFKLDEISISNQLQPYVNLERAQKELGVRF